MSYRIGVVGAGGMGRLYIRLFSRIPDAEVIAVSDVDLGRARKAAEEYGVPSYTGSWREMVDRGDLDAVAVCTPVKFHKEVAVAALESGKHVISEKPPAMNSKEAVEMAEAARRSGRVLMYGFQWRFAGRARYVRSLIEEGLFGDIYRVRIHYLRREGAPSGAGGWFRKKALAGGGVLIDCGVHFLDLAYWLLGRPRPIRAFGVKYNLLGRGAMDVEDTFIGMIVFEGGTSLVIENSWLQNWRNELSFHLFGTKSGASLYPELELFTRVGGPHCSVRPLVEDGDPNAAKLEHFLRTIEEGPSDVTPTAEDGVVLMRIVDALYSSSEKGEAVEVL